MRDAGVEIGSHSDSHRDLRRGKKRLAGKTGTAQASLHGRQDTIAWFVCFAPYEKPRYAVCVMVQGGAHGGSVAAPIAAKILEETLAMDRGTYQPLVVALPPARHPDPFRMIEAVNVESSTPRLAASDDTEPSEPASVGKPRRGDSRDFAPPRLRKPNSSTNRDPTQNVEVRRAEPATPPRLSASSIPVPRPSTPAVRATHSAALSFRTGNAAAMKLNPSDVGPTNAISSDLQFNNSAATPRESFMNPSSIPVS